MGEYVMLDGVQIKIGTCEDLRYCDFPTYVDWLVAGRLAHCRGNEQPLDYMRPGAGASRFRFDGSEATGNAVAGDAYNPTATVPAPLGFLLGEWDHGKVRADIYPSGNRFQPGYIAPHWYMESPCPNGPDWTDARPFDVDYVQIWAAKPMNIGRPFQMWTCIQCPWCTHIARLDDVHAAVLVQSWDGERADLAARIIAGYVDIEAEPPHALTGAGAILWARWQAAKLVQL